MIQRALAFVLGLCALSSCDDALNAGASAGKAGSIADQIRISSESKPEIVAAFEAISNAASEHNRVLIRNIAGDGPVNGPAYSAGIGHLDRSAREHGGLAKSIIDAIATTWVYEKTLFVPFDTMRAQSQGMATWSTSQATQRRGYIHIIDEEIRTYDEAVSYLERGEEPLLRQNFDKHGVPREVADEFFRLRLIWGKEVAEYELEMFREGRAGLHCFREGFAELDPTRANEHIAAGNGHLQKAKQFESKMIAEIRKQLGSEGLL